MADRIVLPPALGAFPWLYKPRPPMANSKNPRSLYQIVLIWKKAEKDKLAALAHAVKKAAVEKFGAEALSNPKFKLRMPIRDGDTEREGYPEFRESLFLTASSERKPAVVDVRGQAISEDEADEEAYSGCTFVASVVPFAYDTQGNKGVSVGLRNVMVKAKGPRLDGGVSAEEEFKDLFEGGGGGGAPAEAGDVDDILGG